MTTASLRSMLLFGAVLSLANFVCQAAFIQRKSFTKDDRSSRLHESGSNAFKNGIRFLLVPNAKKQTPADSSSFIDPTVTTPQVQTMQDAVVAETTAANTLSNNNNNNANVDISTNDVADKISSLVAPLLGTPESSPEPTKLAETSAATAQIINNDVMSNAVTDTSTSSTDAAATATINAASSGTTMNVPPAVTDTLPSYNSPNSNFNFPDFTLPKPNMPDFTLPKPNMPDFTLPKPNMPDFNVDSSVLTFPSEKFDTSYSKLGEVLRNSDSTKLSDAIDALDLDNLGGWYIGFFAVFLATFAFTATPPTPVPAPEIPKNITLAPSPTSTLKATAPNVTAENPVTSGTSDIIAENLRKLQDEIKSLNSELNSLKDSKTSTDYQLATLKSDLRDVKNNLEDANRNEKQLQKAIHEAELELKRETTRYEQELDSVYNKLGKDRKAESEVDKEPPKKDVTVEIIEPNYFASILLPQKETDDVSKEGLKGKDSVKGQTKRKGAAEPETVKSSASKSSSKKNAKRSKKAQSSVNDDDDEEEADDASNAKLAEIDAEWASLSPSAIRRKTVKDLKEFLDARDESTIDNDGNAYKKNDLVDKVMSLLKIEQ